MKFDRLIDMKMSRTVDLLIFICRVSLMLISLSWKILFKILGSLLFIGGTAEKSMEEVLRPLYYKNSIYMSKVHVSCSCRQFSAEFNKYFFSQANVARMLENIKINRV